MNNFQGRWFGGDRQTLGSAIRQRVLIPVVIGPAGGVTNAQYNALLARIAALEAGSVPIPPAGSQFIMVMAPNGSPQMLQVTAPNGTQQFLAGAI